MESWENFTLGD